MTPTKLNDKINQLKGERKILRDQVKLAKKIIKDTEQSIEDHQEARRLISVASELAQTHFKKKVEKLVTLAIQAVFGQGLAFVLDIRKSRNKTECRPLVKEGEDLYEPRDDMGGGIIDVISIALRFVMWSLQTKKTIPFFLLDEPFKFVGKGDLLDRAGQFIVKLSNKLKAQILIITHEPQLAEIGNSAYHILKINKKSVVKVLKHDKARLRRRRRRVTKNETKKD